MIRPATTDDVPGLLALGRAMHAESRYAAHPWAEGRVRVLIESLMASDDGLALVAVRDGEVVGGFLGWVQQHWSVDALTAGDYALFVRPGARGGVIGMALVRAYRAWATERGVSPDLLTLGITTGVSVEATTRLFAVAGFRPIGPLFEASP